MSFFEELKRRDVFRVGIAYTVTAWLLIQVTDIIFPRIGLPGSAVKTIHMRHPMQMVRNELRTLRGTDEFF